MFCGRDARCICSKKENVNCPVLLEKKKRTEERSKGFIAWVKEQRED